MTIPALTRLAEHPAAPSWHRNELGPLLEVPALPDPIRQLITQHTRAYAAWVDARHALADADADLRTAREQDTTTAAAAVAAGKPLPAPSTAVKTAEQRLDHARRAEQIHAQAVAQVEREIIRAVTEHAPTWTRALTQHEHALGEQLTATAAQLADLLRQRALVRNARALLHDPRRIKSWHNLANTYVEDLAAQRVREILQLAETGDPAVFHAIQPASPPPEPAA
ncbi:MAG TPA: hypothetical protein VIL36_08995 [Acidimicrobiales bacterium]